MAKPITTEARRAARLTRLPGVTIAEASRKTGVPAREVSRVRRTHEEDHWPDRAGLVVAALTNYAELRAGELGDLDPIARFVDWQNHDGSTADDVRRLLDELVADGVLEVGDGKWRLLVEWP
jgi:hypothetical protein